MDQLTPLQLHALQHIAKSASKVRGKLSVGAHQVDFGVQVCGTVTVSGDQAYSATKKPDLVTVAALLLGTYGPRKRKAIVDEILSGDFRDGLNDELRELSEVLINGLTSFKPETRRGSVSGDLDVAVID